LKEILVSAGQEVGQIRLSLFLSKGTPHAGRRHRYRLDNNRGPALRQREGDRGYKILQTGADSRKAAESASKESLLIRGVRIGFVVHRIDRVRKKKGSMAQQTVTEITCIAKGVNFLFPDARTIIDIGGQDTKVIGSMEAAVG
jgi:hypothetical protein